MEFRDRGEETPDADPVKMRESFLTAVRESSELPDPASESLVSGVNQQVFDDTYLQWLDQQIETNARGDEWSARLRKRREGLANYSLRNLIDGSVRHGDDRYWIKVDPASERVVYWEVYESEYADGG